MWSAEQIQPYVNLLTWQVVALMGGLFFGPALYVIAFRARRLSVLGATAELTRDEARELEDEAESKVQARASNNTSVESAAREIEEISDEPAGPKEEMYKNVVEAQLTLASIARAISQPYGGDSNLRAFKRNIEILRTKQLVPRDEIDRLIWFYERRFEFRRDPAKLTVDTYKAFMRRARRTAKRLTKHVPSSAVPSASTMPRPHAQNSLPN